MAADKRCLGFLSLCFFVGVIVLIVTGVLVAKPGLPTLQFLIYHNLRVNLLRNPQSTMCSPVGREQRDPVFCGGERMSYPCYLINVTYDTEMEDGTTITITSTIRQSDATPPNNIQVIIERQFPEGDIIAALAVPAILAFIALVLICVVVVSGRPKKAARYSPAKTTETL